MTSSLSGAAGAGTAIAGSNAKAGAAPDGAALAGALSNAASSRCSRAPPKTAAPASVAKAMTASVVHSLRRKLRGGGAERADTTSTAASRAAAVTSGPKMRAASSMAWARESARYAGDIEMILLRDRSNALTTVDCGVTVEMTVAAHCDGRHSNIENFAGEAIFRRQSKSGTSVRLELHQRTAERATSDGRDSSASGFAGSPRCLSATGADRTSGPTAPAAP